MRKLSVLIMAAAGALAAYGQEAAPAQAELEKRREEFRRVAREFENSAEYRQQREAIERALSAARKAPATAEMREAIKAAEASPELLKQRSELGWVLEKAASSFERLDHLNRLRQECIQRMAEKSPNRPCPAIMDR